MILKKWEELPESLKTDAVRPYYDLLAKRRGSLLLKRCFDIVVSALMLLVLSPVFLVLAIAIKLDSPGPVFYRQVRVTQYGKEFRIFKFRSMVSDADKRGSLVTVSGDSRITRVGHVIRNCRLDELCQGGDAPRGAVQPYEKRQAAQDLRRQPRRLDQHHGACPAAGSYGRTHLACHQLLGKEL